MSNFIPDLNDPRTRGWGGHEYEYDCGNDRGYFIFSWLGFIVLFALPFTQTPGGILIATLLLWLMLGILTPSYYATSQAGGNLRAPAVICDPQGLTIYNSNQRIEYQWRWQELDSVSARNNGLRIIPRDDLPRLPSRARYGNPPCHCCCRHWLLARSGAVRPARALCRH